MDQALRTRFEPRVVDGKSLIVAGFSQRVTPATWCDISTLWRRFAPHIGSVAGQVPGRVVYGVVTDAADSIDYLAGVEVKSASGLPKDFVHVSLPVQRYAVFVHDGHVSRLKDTMDAIWAWWPKSGLTHARTAGLPAFFERYGEEFDPQKAMGGIEVWVPVKT